MQLPTVAVAALALATSSMGFTLPRIGWVPTLDKRAECRPGYWNCSYATIYTCNGEGRWVPSYNCSQVSACCRVSDGGLNAHCVQC